MRFLIILFFSLVFLTACGPSKKPGQQGQVAPEASIRAMMQAGNFTAAAQAYMNLAEEDSQNASLYRLKASAAYVEAGLYNEAQAVLSSTQIAKKDSLQYIRMKILSARLELEFGRTDKALTILNEISEPLLPHGLRPSFHDIRAKVYLADKDYMRAASERMRLSNYLSTPSEIQQNNRSLWQVMESVPATEVDNLRLAAPEALKSWFELASLYQTYRYQPARLSVAIDGWKQRYPGHPALLSITNKLITQSRESITRPTKIGLLLPLSGKYQKSSTAIRDGFLAAWYMDREEKADIEIYDANALNIVETYQTAISEGVDYIVGPLEKQAINQLVDFGNLTVPVLALNRQDLNHTHTDKQLVQFGLSPEDEATQVAETAMSDGHRLALVITPDNPWGDRLAEAFTNRWIELGGAVLERAFFQSKANDFSSPVKKLLNVDSSEKRARDLRNRLNIKINSVERRREDADFVFTAAVPGDAHQLFPQFRFHRAEDLPVYATSHIFSGIVDNARDIDLNDVMFIDMPWILDTSRQLSIIQDTLNRNWAQDKSQYRRLYALGIDAYHLIPEIGRLRAENNNFLIGETGDLSITPDNIVRRKLRRAQFVEGKPVLLN